MSVELLADPALEDGAEPVFRRITRRLREARRTVEIRMFVWRSDAVGNAVARETLAAAERGVRIRLFKDVGAFMYERIEMNRKSLFNRPVSWRKRLSWRLSSRTFPDTFVEDDHDAAAGDALLAHPGVAVEWVDHTHTKCWIFDDEILLLGSVNLEDRHRGYRDHSVEIAGGEHVARLRERFDGRVPPDPDRPVEFVVNRPPRFEIKGEVLRLLEEARRSVYVEMAYLGDPEVTEALLDASRRGVAVTFLLSRKANIGNDLNYRTLHRMMKRGDVRVRLSPKMVHAKLLLVDDETVLLGSANLSVFSLQKAEEMDVRIRRNPEFAAAVRREADRRLDAAEPVDGPARLAGYSRVLAALQQLHQRLT